MLNKLSYRIYLILVLAFSLSSCSALRGIGNAVANSFKGFTIHFPTFRFP